MPSHFQFSISLEVLPSFCLFSRLFSCVLIFFPTFSDFFLTLFPTFFPTFSRPFSRLFPDFFPTFFSTLFSTFFRLFVEGCEPHSSYCCRHREQCRLISLLKREIFSSEGRQNGHRVHHSFTCNSQEIDSAYTHLKCKKNMRPSVSSSLSLDTFFF